MGQRVVTVLFLPVIKLNYIHMFWLRKNRFLNKKWSCWEICSFKECGRRPRQILDMVFFDIMSIYYRPYLLISALK